MTADFDTFSLSFMFGERRGFYSSHCNIYYNIWWQMERHKVKITLSFEHFNLPCAQFKTNLYWICTSYGYVRLNILQKMKRYNIKSKRLLIMVQNTQSSLQGLIVSHNVIFGEVWITWAFFLFRGKTINSRKTWFCCFSFMIIVIQRHPCRKSGSNLAFLLQANAESSLGGN